MFYVLCFSFGLLNAKSLCSSELDLSQLVPELSDSLLSSLMTVEAFVAKSDVERTIRFIESTPVTVRNDSSEGTTHDIERYCAFQQSSFQEAEALADPSVGFLAQAREARMAILDSTDKAITLIHLLTNNQWGPDVAQFLSCRQSVPSRDKIKTWGDRMVVSDVSKFSTKRLTESIRDDLESFHSHKSLIDSLRNSKYLFEIRCTEEGIAAVIELLPSLHRVVDPIYMSTMLLSTVGRPIMKLHPVIRTLVDKKYELMVHVSDSYEPVTENSPSKSGDEESVLEELQKCRHAALDYAIISSMHDGITNERKLANGWVVTNSSRCVDSLSLVVVGSQGVEVSISLSYPANSVVTTTHTRYLRNAFLDRCCSTSKATNNEILNSFLDYVIQSDR